MFLDERAVIAADAGAINRGGDIADHPACAALINYTTYCQITRLPFAAPTAWDFVS